ncbi:MAG: TetR/AcrR family transcriptional regulator [Gammaproteobacteria bacterium]
MSELAMKRGEASRTRILETAQDALATQGLEGFVMREIAKRADMQLGNLQYYFPTRGDLLEAVIRTEFEHNLATIRSLSEKATSLKDYIDQLSDLLLQEYTGIGGNIWPVLTLLHLHNRRYRQLSEEIYQRHFDTLVDAMRRFGVSGSTAALSEKARLITAIIDGAALQAHAGPHSRKKGSWQSWCRKIGQTAVAIAER